MGWCRVISPRFDYILSPTRMLSKKEGDVVFLPHGIEDIGVNSGDLERTTRPKGFKVDKSGKVVPCAS